MRALPFTGVADLGQRPHVMVDGAARPGTVLTLSHWPGSRTPPELARDLSVESVLAYLVTPSARSALAEAEAEAVTNDHLDQDGLLSVYALVRPEESLACAELLVEVARVGDFAVVQDLAAARIAFALAALADPERSRLDGVATGSPDGPAPDGPAPDGPAPDGPAPGSMESMAAATAEILGVLPELLDHPGRFRAYYGEELASFCSSWLAVERGDVRVRSGTPRGLAVVDVSETLAPVTGSRLGRYGKHAVHPAVLHSLVDDARVLVVQGRRYSFHDRYETWVNYPSRRFPLRRDLEPLAARLSGEESGGARWRADPPGALEPHLELEPGAVSSIDDGTLVGLVAGYLESAPVAWDPFARSGPLGTAGASAGTGLSGPAGPRGGTTDRGRARSRGRWRGRSSA